MRIAVNTRLLLPGRLDGIGWFSYESLRRIVAAHPEHEFLFLFDRKPDPQFLFASNVKSLVLCPQARHPVLWYLFFEWSVTRALRRYKADLFLSPDGWMSLRTKVPTLTVIHDLNFEHASDYLRPSHQRYMTRFFPRFARKATRVATVSEFSKQDLVDTYGIGAEKIDVVYDGSHSNYQPVSEDLQQSTRLKYTQGKPYFIFIGTISKRKNITNILLAYDKMRAATPQSQEKLVVVGHKFWWEGEVVEAYENMRFKDDVVFLGRAEADELSLLLGSARALLYCSLFEGFGIPIIEAFNAHTPVVTSNLTSMPEVAGDAALLVDPYDTDAMAEAFARIATDDELCSTLVERGLSRRNLFNWDRTAALLWESMSKTIQQC